MRLSPAEKMRCLYLAFLAVAGLVFLLSPRQHVDAATGINKQINFQGKVVNANATNVANGDYSFLFCIYTTASSATPCTAGANNDAIWRESKTLTVTDGIFRTALGDTTAFPGSVDFNTDNIYLGINFNGDGEMTPRVRFTAVPYAFNAEKVGGLTVTNTTGTLTIPNAKTISFGDAFTTSGANPLTLTTTGTTDVTLPTGGTLLTNTTASNQTVTSTQSTGTVFGITDSTALTGAIKGLVITLSGANAQDQTGLEFNLSNASGTNLNDIVGTASSWKVSKAGALTVASCTGCGGGSQTPWTQNIDADNFSLLDLGTNITSRAGLTVTSTTGNINLQAAGTATTGNVQIGAGGAGSTTPDLLVLDVKSDAEGSLAGTNGAMYYNASTNKFRCYQNSTWTDCIGTGGSGVPKESHVIFFAESSALSF